MTPKGSQPGDRRPPAGTAASAPSTPGHVSASSRYTPRAEKRQLVPPSWIPVIMVALLIGGGLMIMARYLVFTGSNAATFIGLGMILGGLFTATKWQ